MSSGGWCPPFQRLGNRVLTTLLPQDRVPAAIRADLQKRNARVLAAFRKALAMITMSMRTLEQHVETIAVFARWLLEQEPPRGLLELTGSDLERYLGMPTTRVNPVSFRRFVRFLRTTGRLEYDDAEDLADVL